MIGRIFESIVIVFIVGIAFYIFQTFIDPWIKRLEAANPKKLLFLFSGLICAAVILIAIIENTPIFNFTPAPVTINIPMPAFDVGFQITPLSLGIRLLLVFIILAFFGMIRLYTLFIKSIIRGLEGAKRVIGERYAYLQSSALTGILIIMLFNITKARVINPRFDSMSGWVIVILFDFVLLVLNQYLLLHFRHRQLSDGFSRTIKIVVTFHLIPFIIWFQVFFFILFA